MSNQEDRQEDRMEEILKTLAYSADREYGVDEDVAQAHSEIMAIIFEECEKVSQEYQKRIREEYVPKTLMLTEEEIASELLEALVLILPLAKGYVAKNQVGSNQKYIEMAQQAIHKAQEGKLK